MTFGNTHIIRKSRQLLALRSPGRLQVVAALSQMGESSVRDIAQQTNRSPESLQYHMRELVRSGLAVSTGKRHANHRMERVYELVGRDLEIDRSSSDPEYLHATEKVYSAAFRNADREMAKTLRTRTAKFNNAEAAPLLVQTSFRMSKAAMKKLHEKIQDVQRFIIENESASASGTCLITLAISSDNTTGGQ